MKVLMFGWEYPPNISGGLGTACYGLTKGLTSLDGIDLTFIVPKVYGNEDKTGINLIGAGDVMLSGKKLLKQRKLEKVCDGRQRRYDGRYDQISGKVTYC